MILRELFVKLGLVIDESGFAKAETKITALKTGLLGLAGGIGAGFGLELQRKIGEVAHELTHLHSEVADAAIEAKHGAERVGVSTESYEELSYAAGRAHVSVGELEMSLRFLARAQYNAQKGNHELARTFSILGVTPGKKGPDELLMQLADGFQRLHEKGDPRAQALAIELFGRAGTRLLPVLYKGRAGLSELRLEAHKLGLVFNEDAIKAAERYDRAKQILRGAMLGLKRAIGVPILEWMAGRKEKLAEWLLDNSEKLRRTIVPFVKQVIAFLDSWVEMFSRIGRWFVQLVSHSDTFRNSMVLLGTVMSAIFAPWKLLLGAILLIIEDIWGYFSGTRETVLDEIIGKPWAEAKKELQPYLDALSKAWDAISSFVGDAISVISDGAADLLAVLKGPLLDVWQSALPAISAVWDLLKAVFGFLGDILSGPIGSALWQFLKVEAVGALEIIKVWLDGITLALRVLETALNGVRRAWAFVSGQAMPGEAPSREKLSPLQRAGRFLSYAMPGVAEQDEANAHVASAFARGALQPQAVAHSSGGAAALLGLPSVFGPPIVNVPSPASQTVVRQAAPVTIGTLNVQGAPTDQPRDWAAKVFEEMQSQQLQDAYQAGAR